MSFGFFQFSIMKRLKIFLFVCFMLLVSSKWIEAKSQGVLGSVFFLRDIEQFVGHPYPSPALKTLNVISQGFNSSCANLNRIILPFWINSDQSDEAMIFTLYDENENQILIKKIFSKDFPPQKKIGTHHLDGILHYIWIPLQEESKNKYYHWTLNSKEESEARAGIFLTHKLNSRVGPVVLDGVTQKDTFVAFYTFCEYRFHWNEIFIKSLNRILQEKWFFGFYLLTLIVLILKIGKGKASEASGL